MIKVQKFQIVILIQNHWSKFLNIPISHMYVWWKVLFLFKRKYNEQTAYFWIIRELVRKTAVYCFVIWFQEVFQQQINFFILSVRVWVFYFLMVRIIVCSSLFGLCASWMDTTFNHPISVLENLFVKWVFCILPKCTTRTVGTFRETQKLLQQCKNDNK